LNQAFHLSGVLITDVEEGSPAFESVLKPGDVIIETNQQPVTNVETFQKFSTGIVGIEFYCC
jgi:S1-C subfamily serine protease